MAKAISKFEGSEVTEAMLEEAATLFSQNYGIWGDNGFGKPGSRVKMNSSRLRSQCLPPNSRNFYVNITTDGALVGNAFASRWDYAGRQVCWVTQLVVHRGYREQNIATTLLLHLIDPDDQVFGIMSSHPAACKTLAKAVGDISLSKVPLDFAREHAAGIIAASPVDYVKQAKVRGSLFDNGDASGLVSGVDSNFYVDHAEPFQALARVRAGGGWPLGELPDGHEFLLLVERTGQSRPRLASSNNNPKKP